MATEFKSAYADTENPYITRGMRRRSAAPVVDTRPATEDPTSGFGQRVRSAQEQYVGAAADALPGLVAKVLGDEAEAQRQFAEYDESQQRAAALGPDVQTLEDVDRRGGALGAYGEWAATQAVNLAPDLLTSLTGAGLGASVGRGLARRAVQASVSSAARHSVERRATQKLAENVVQSQGSKTAEQVARAKLVERTTQRTLRKFNPQLDDAAEYGQIVGATAGQMPGVVSDSVEALKETDQAGAVKIATADTLSAVFGSLPVHRLLGKIGGQAADEAIGETAKRFLPRVAKEFAAQGAAEGSVGVGQAAIQLAGHKWVNDNVDLLGPEALERYLAELVGGGIVGGALGAGVEAGKGVQAAAGKAVDAAGRGLGALRTSIRDSLSKAAERKRAAVAATQAATEGASAYAAQAKADVADLFRRAKDGASADVSQAKADVADVLSTFKTKLGGLLHDDQLDADADRITQRIEALSQPFESGEADAPFEISRRPSSNPVQLESPIQNLLATHLPTESPLWGFPEEAQTLFRSAEKLLTGDERTARDERNIDLLRDVLPDQVALWEAAGPRFAELTTKLKDYQPETEAEPSGAMADAFRDAGVARTRAPIDSAESAGAVETSDANSMISERDALPTPTRAETLASLRPDDPRYAEARAALREEIVGAATPTARFGKNVFYESSNTPAAKAAFNKAAGEASRVEIEPVNVGRTKPIMARALLSLDSLILQQRGRDPNITPRDALLRAFADAALAGVNINPESIKVGDLGHSEADGSYLGRLTPNDVKQLRNAVKQSPTGKRVVGEESPAARDLREEAEGTATLIEEAQRDLKGQTFESRDAAADALEGAFVAQKRRMQAGVKVGDEYGAALRRDWADAAQGEITGDGTDPRDRQLGPRSAPPGTRQGQDFVPTENVVLEADGVAGYADVRAKARSGELSPFDAGLQIGEAEIRKAQLNPRREAVLLKRLRNPGSGVAVRYFQRARRGEFDRGFVRNTPTDDAALTPEGKTLDRAYKDAPTSPKPTKLAGRERWQAEKLQLRARKQRDDAPVPPEQKAKLLHDADEVESTLTADGAHDLARETDMLNAILAEMGIADTITLVDTGVHRRSGLYATGSSQIRIGSALTGAERIEVLAHELGHHIIRSEIARAGGVDVKELRDFDSVAVMWLHERTHPELHAALMEDYDAWRLQMAGSELTAGQVRASRAALHRAQQQERNTTLMRELDAFDVEQMFAMEEWLADHIARALTSRSEGQGVIGRFFRGIADKLRSLYSRLFSKGSQWAPAPSVDAWVKSLFDRTTLAASRALQQPVSAGQAQATVSAAVRTAAAGGGGSGMIPAGPPTGGGPGGPGGYRDLVRFVRLRLTPKSRQILDRVLNREVVTKRLRQVYAGHDGALRALDSAKTGLEARIALAYMAWKRGEFTVGPQGTSLLNGFSDDLAAVLGLAGSGAYAQRIFADISNGAIERFHQANKAYDVVQLEARGRGALQAGVNHFHDVAAKISEPWSKFIDGTYTRMRDWGIPAARQVAAALQKASGTTGEDRGMNPAIVHTTAKYMQRAARAIEDLTPRQQVRVLDILQRQLTSSQLKAPAHIWHAVGQIRGLMKDMYDYAREAGVELGHRDTYFPVQIDLRNDAAREKLRALLSQPKFEARIRELVGGGTKQKPSTKLMQDLVDDMLRGASNSDDAVAQTQDGPPNFRPANYRLMAFVYELGDAKDIEQFAGVQSKNIGEVFARYIEPAVKRAEYARRFGDDGARLNAMLQAMKTQGATDAQVTETRSAVEAALGTYGADGSPVIKLVSPALAAKLAGRKTQSALAGLQAYQNARLLPLSLLSSLVDPMGIAVRTGGDFKTAWTGFKQGMKALLNKQTRREMDDMMMAIGSVADAVSSDVLNAGFGRTRSPTARRVNETVFKLNGLNAWTRTTRYMALESAHGFLLKHADGTDDTSKRYLAELGLRPGDVELVWVFPTGSGNARRQVNTQTGDAARDKRVANALLQFVDEAILRPNSQQTPLWHSDPYMGFVAQYKAFAYAIADQIGGRIARELRHSNGAVVLPALAYVPIVLAAELLRELVQHGPEGNPQREDWGPGDYTLLAAERTGLLGPARQFQLDAVQDAQAKRVPGSSQLGPTGGQVTDVVDVLRGRGDYGKAFEDALPASPLWKRWNDDPEGFSDNLPTMSPLAVAMRN